MRAMTWRDRIDEIAVRWALSGEATARLAALLELVRDDPGAPTTVRDPPAAVDVHLADSLVALDIPAVRGAGTIADLGAGAGFPGLPLALALTRARVSLVESSSRKCRFLTRAIEVTAAANAEVVCERVESWSVRGLDVVCARAVAPLAVLVEYAAPLLAVGGTFVAWKGEADASEIRDGRAAAAQLGLEVGEVLAVEPFAGSQRRTLHLYSKGSETPPGYPRRPGIARKRPLSA
jgi:16S rRNA (guanine527-N7)-methyltransferase